MTCYMPHALPPPRARGRAKRTVCVKRADPPPKSRRPSIYGREAEGAPPETLRGSESQTQETQP